MSSYKHEGLIEIHLGDPFYNPSVKKVNYQSITVSVIFKSSLMTLLSSASSGTGTTEPTENLFRTLWSGASRTTSSSVQGERADGGFPAHSGRSTERTSYRSDMKPGMLESPQDSPVLPEDRGRLRGKCLVKLQFPSFV